MTRGQPLKWFCWTALFVFLTTLMAKLGDWNAFGLFLLFAVACGGELAQQNRLWRIQHGEPE